MLLPVAALSTATVLGCAKEVPPPPPPTVAVEEGPGEAAALVTATATVEAVDQKTRMVTLRTADGEQIRFRAGENVRNLAQVRKGDLVKVTYSESIAVRLRETRSGRPSMSVTEEVERAALGQKPGGLVVRQVNITAKVIAVDRRKQMVTLEGPERNVVSLKVADPRNLEGVEPGEMVEATYREALGISVEKPTR
jgi:hypothetical protein